MRKLENDLTKQNTVTIADLTAKMRSVAREVVHFPAIRAGLLENADRLDRADGIAVPSKPVISYQKPAIGNVDRLFRR